VPKRKAKLTVNHPKALTTRWAQRVARYQLQCSSTTINRIETVALDVGTTTRVRLALDHDCEALPKRWFVKLPSLSLRARAITALPRLLPTEVRFYNDLASRIPLTVPKVIVAHSQFGKGSTLVMADVSEFGATPGKVGDALDAGQAALVAGQLADLHAAFWGKADNDQSLRWLASPVRQLEDSLGTALAVPLMQRGLVLAGDAVPIELHGPALGYARKRKQIMQFLADAPPTLTHHDCHPGNLFWHEGKPGFLDWQMVRIGEGVGDISYFMATALEPETRRACEFEVLRHYFECLQAKVGRQGDFDALVKRYQVHLAYAFEAMTLTLAVGRLMAIEDNLTMIRRASTAVMDHGSFALVAKVL